MHGFWTGMTIAGLLLASGGASAELVWGSTSTNLVVHPLQSAESACFEFKNSGDVTVEIIKLKPSCGCISGKIEKKVYLPGESGSLEVTFSLEKREGPQRKGIAVETSDGKTVQLYLSTNIKPTFKLSMKRLVWASGEDRGSKSLLIQNRHQAPFRLEEALPKLEGVSVELITKREGFEYELVVKPDPGVKNILIPITLVPETPDGVSQVKTFTAYALLK